MGVFINHMITCGGGGGGGGLKKGAKIRQLLYGKASYTAMGIGFLASSEFLVG